MAPTEVLAEQHYLGSLRLLEGLTVPAEGSLLADRPVGVALLTNRTTAAERRRIAAGLDAGEIDILVGTHALLYGDARFSRLGLAVVDEQHRFGVEQRALLRGKGDQPDVLVMTATPIPRTAAMLVYGDLDKSELRELPPGRTPIETRLVDPSPLSQAVAWDALRAQVAAGHQAYVVCPLVEDKGKVEAKAATVEYERLQAEELHDLRVGLLHGQMPSKEKEAVMRAYRAGELDVLVATTVIEVGVDVPNATVMVVEDADLEIRGSGEVFGERQSGFSDLKLGRIPRDEAIVMQARGVAEEILDRDPELAVHTQLRDEVHELLGDAVDFLFKS